MSQGKVYMNIGFPTPLHELLVRQADKEKTDKTKILIKSFENYLTSNKSVCKIPPVKK